MKYVPGMTIAEIMEYIKSYSPPSIEIFNKIDPKITLLELELINFEVFKRTGLLGPWCPNTFKKDWDTLHECDIDYIKKVFYCRDCEIGGDLISAVGHKYELSPIKVIEKLIRDYDIQFPGGPALDTEYEWDKKSLKEALDRFTNARS